jgi:uncharacterized protein (UPF0276 family)
VAAPGVGLLVQPELQPFIEHHLDLVDHLEVVPDTGWTDLGPRREPRYVDDTELLVWLDRVGVPVALHSIGLSIGSVHRFDLEHVAQIERWQRRLAAPWHSDHLAWHLAETPAGEVNVNLTMPVGLDQETQDLIVDRVRAVQATVDAPFLLENNVYYYDHVPVAIEEATFLTAIARRTGCGILLDLHNLWVNVTNRGWDAGRYLDSLALDRVVEIHVAGGLELDGFLLDAHSGAAPDEVWSLLADVAPRCPGLRGVTFELFGTWFEPLGADGLAAQLERARAVLDGAFAARGHR